MPSQACVTADLMRRQLENGEVEHLPPAEKRRWLKRFRDAVAQCAISLDRGLNESSRALAGHIAEITAKNKELKRALKDSTLSFSKKLATIDGSLRAVKTMLDSPASKRRR